MEAVSRLVRLGEYHSFDLLHRSGLLANDGSSVVVVDDFLSADEIAPLVQQVFFRAACPSAPTQ